MAKAKAMSKKCPQCEHEVATATKLCPCGFSFFEKRKSSRAQSGSEEAALSEPHQTRSGGGGEGGRRRGVRVRKETQTYGTTVPSASLDTKIRSPKAGSATPGNTTTNTKKRRGAGGKDSPAVQDEDTNSEEGTKRKRGRKGREERFQEQEEKLMARITPAKANRYSLILNHINYMIRQESFHREQDCGKPEIPVRLSDSGQPTTVDSPARDEITPAS